MMYIRPKLHEHYWYVGEDDQGLWTILEKDNENDSMDKYNMASQNCFPEKEIAEEQFFDQISQQTREDGYQLWLAQQRKEV